MVLAEWPDRFLKNSAECVGKCARTRTAAHTVPPEIATWSFGQLDFSEFGHECVKDLQEYVSVTKDRIWEIFHTQSFPCFQIVLLKQEWRNLPLRVVSWGFGDYLGTIENLVLSSQHHTAASDRGNGHWLLWYCLHFLCDPLGNFLVPDSKHWEAFSNGSIIGFLGPWFLVGLGNGIASAEKIRRWEECDICNVYFLEFLPAGLQCQELSALFPTWLQ